MNTKNWKNFLVGLFSQLVVLVIGLIIPRIILTHYGSDTNGLINTITQIFTYMALLEAGIGMASRNALFKPLIKNDRETVSKVLSASRVYYRKISYIYFGVVIFLAIVLPLILKTEIDYLTIFVFVIFEGLTNVVAFYFTNTWRCLLGADGKTYIVDILALVNKILCYGIRIILAIYSINIALTQVGYFAISLLQLAIYYVYMRKNYGWVNYKVKPNDYKLSDRNAYIISEISTTVFSSTDLIVLSIFVSTSLSSVYSTYNLIFTALSGILSSVYNALNYTLGQTFHIDIEKYKRVHDQETCIFLGGATVMMCVAYWLTLPFIRLYTEGINDINYIYRWLPLLFCLVQILSWSRYVSSNLLNIAGDAKKLSFISCIEATINIVGSVILVNFFGITGVLIATVCALPVKIIYCIYVSDIKILKRSPQKSFCILGINYFIFALTVIMRECFFEIYINNYLDFIWIALVLTIIYSVIVVGANILIEHSLVQLIGRTIRFRNK